MEGKLVEILTQREPSRHFLVLDVYRTIRRFQLSFGSPELSSFFLKCTLLPTGRLFYDSSIDLQRYSDQQKSERLQVLYLSLKSYVKEDLAAILVRNKDFLSSLFARYDNGGLTTAAFISSMEAQGIVMTQAACAALMRRDVQGDIRYGDLIHALQTVDEVLPPTTPAGAQSVQQGTPCNRMHRPSTQARDIITWSDLQPEAVRSPNNSTYVHTPLTPPPAQPSQNSEVLERRDAVFADVRAFVAGQLGATQLKRSLAERGIPVEGQLESLIAQHELGSGLKFLDFAPALSAHFQLSPPVPRTYSIPSSPRPVPPCATPHGDIISWQSPPSRRECVSREGRLHTVPKQRDIGDMIAWSGAPSSPQVVRSPRTPARVLSHGNILTWENPPSPLEQRSPPWLPTPRTSSRRHQTSTGAEPFGVDPNLL